MSVLSLCRSWLDLLERRTLARWLLLGVLYLLMTALGRQSVGLPGVRCEDPGAFLSRRYQTPILAFELVSTSACAEKFHAAWSPLEPQGRNQVLLDFPYILAYSSLLWLCCRGASRGLGRAGHARLARFGELLARGQLLAGGCDVVENLGLLAILAGATAQPVPLLTTAFSLAKWLLVLAGILYSLGGAYESTQKS
ncbi:MAG: hypothetical protein U0002_11605 [Thermoanaerobaculia bacterium]